MMQLVGFVLSVLVFVICVASLEHEYVYENSEKVERHVLNHGHIVRCRFCFCGHMAMTRARHHCPGNRELVECADKNRKCYRCSCKLRDISTPSVDEENSASASAVSVMEVAASASVTPSGSASVSISVSPSASSSASPSPSVSPLVCTNTIRAGKGGVSVFSLEVGKKSGSIVLKYTTNIALERFSISYDGDLSYNLPSNLQGVIDVHFRGSSSVMRISIVAMDGTAWQTSMMCS
eukprot:TRINITY_DN26573_c0_g2_i1.p1 TRINITY_DN26573_c0_g2~~TRINITY_DN26573_c0_g2_i1.p1  ORF type:complete len:236 (-),score=18.21 TRINITY_DN26573_c0_g2_i1:115-822(-)